MRTTRLLLPAAILIMALFSCTQGPEKVAKQFLDAQESRDFKTMKTLSTPESQQMIDMLESLMAKDTSKAKPNPVKITKCDLKDSTALCTYCCDGEGKEGTIHVKKTANGWKVDMSKETLMGGKEEMDKLIRSSAEPDSLSGAPDSLNAAPERMQGDTGKTVPGQ